MSDHAPFNPSLTLRVYGEKLCSIQPRSDTDVDIIIISAFKSVDPLGPPTGWLVPDRLNQGDNDLMILSYVIKNSFQKDTLGVTRVKTARKAVTK